MGSSIMTARFWGAKDHDSTKKAVTVMYRFTFLLITIFFGVTLAAPEKIMRLYTTDPAVIREGARYLSWSLPSYFHQRTAHDREGADSPVQLDSVLFHQCVFQLDFHLWQTGGP